MRTTTALIGPGLALLAIAALMSIALPAVLP